MIHAEHYLSSLIDLLKTRFNQRLLYVGLQGSYLRGEATEDSDIDIMVVIDELSILDLDNYRTIIQSLDHFDKSCGFICSKADLANWNPLEICHLVNSTKDYYGVLEALVPSYAKTDLHNFVKLSVNNLYHEICHRYIHASMDKNIMNLPQTYKVVFFILQNKYYLENGEYIQTKSELLAALNGKDKAILECAIALKENADYNFIECYSLLFTWCQETLQSL